MNYRAVLPVCIITATLVFCMLINRIASFNIDTAHPLVYQDPQFAGATARQSYFGYSVQFLFGQTGNAHNSAKWLLVGAPRANSTHRPSHATLMEPGRVDRCLLGNPSTDNCKQLVIENAGEQFSNDRDKYFRERKDYGWLGGSMAVSSPTTGRVAVCSHRWTNKIDSREYKMNGACYWSNHQVPEKTDFNKTIPLVYRDLQVTSNGTYNYAFGQAGMSVHMVRHSNGKEEMIIGAPGVFGWTGAVIRVSDYVATSHSGIPSRKKRQDDTGIIDFGESFVPNMAKTPQLGPNDYFGYSVHSGKLLDSKKIIYVAGAPRSSDMKGKVILFDFGKESLLDVRMELKGEQLGEYFGASVLAINLNRDGLDDLLVGAPQHSLHPESSARSGDEGKVYVYISRNGILKEVPALYGSRSQGARFGTSMASAGDINRDGFNDVVIGAPYEDDKGAVYLYLGGSEGILRHPDTIYWQRIAAEDFSSPPLDGLKGFGISLSIADFDNNQYPDLAVGSYLSGHALVFRSRPVIKFGLTIKPQSDGLIDPNNGGTITLTACANVHWESSMPEICLAQSFFFDAGYLNNPRLILEDEKRQKHVQQPFNFTHTFRSAEPKCRTFKLSVGSSSYYNQDYSRPAVFRLVAELRTSQCLAVADKDPGSKYVLIPNTRRREDSFCANCPVEDRREENFVESSRAFASECGEDGSCTADLEIKATFPGDHREYVIGSTKVIPFKVDVTNHGEPAYVPRLEIQLPGQTRLQGKKVDELCDKPSLGQFGEWRYSCRLKANPLKHSKTDSMEFELDVTSLNGAPGRDESLTLVIEARTSSAEAKGSSTKVNLTLPLRTAMDVEVVGNAEQEQQTYIRPNGTDIRERVPFHHLYEVRNVLPTAVSKAEIEVIVPVNISARGDVVPLLESPTLQVSQKGRPFAISCTRSNRLVGQQAIGDIKLLVKNNPPTYKFAQANRTSFIDCLNNKEITCDRFTCTAGLLSKDAPITLSLSGTLLLGNILSYIDPKDVFILSSAARVIIQEPSNAQQPANHRPDASMASAHFLPQGPPEMAAVAGWIIGLAVLAGILLLCLLAYALYKIGFFKRKRYGKEDLVDRQDPPTDPSESQRAGEPSSSDDDVRL